jgi:hypothetical protein
VEATQIVIVTGFSEVVQKNVEINDTKMRLLAFNLVGEFEGT